MQPKKPSVSVLLPVHNVGHYLATCLDSLLESTHEDFEVIAIDDFSRDDTWKILKIYKQLDKRIRIYRNVKHYGKAITLNRALKKAKGHLLALMDGKDMVYKNRLKKQAAYLQNNPQVVAVGTQCTFINSIGRSTGKSAFPQHTETIYHRPLHGIALDFETIMINKTVLPKDLLYFNTSESAVLYSDITMKLLQFGNIINLPHFLQYRRTENPHRKTTFKKIPSLIKLWIQSMDTYEYRPNLRSFLNTFRSPDLSTQ